MWNFLKTIIIKTDSEGTSIAGQAKTEGRANEMLSERIARNGEVKTFTEQEEDSKRVDTMKVKGGKIEKVIIYDVISTTAKDSLGGEVPD